MLRQRIITAIVLATVLLAVILYAPRLWFVVTLGIVLLIAAWEWSRLCGLTKINQRLIYLTLWAGVTALCFRFYQGHLALYMVTTLWWLLVAVRLLVFPAGQMAWPRAEMIASGIIFLAVTFVGLDWLRLQPHGKVWILILLAIVWTADIAAYFFGRHYGRKKLAPLISPGKTIEGMQGAIISVMVITAIISALLGMTLGELLLAVAFSGFLVIISVVGDLFESKSKRQQGLKDSGSILPGHGGMLDRIDSMIAVLPFFVLALMLLFSYSNTH